MWLAAMLADEIPIGFYTPISHYPADSILLIICCELHIQFFIRLQLPGWTI
jgi:hypothetical protein